MTKFTRKIKGEIAAMLSKYQAEMAPNAPGWVRLSYLREKVDALDTEDARVTWVEARNAAHAAGWKWVVKDFVSHFFRGPEHFEAIAVIDEAKNESVIVSTRYAPRDLLNGRLAALDSPETDS